MIIQYDPSVIGTIKIDGKGSYRAFKKSGHYSFNTTSRKFTFVSGPLRGWPTVYQVSGGTPMLHLAATRDRAVGASTRTGEHSCRLRTSRKYANTPASTGGGGTGNQNTTGGLRNGGARGTSTFRESWGSDRIVDVNLATGNVLSRFEGTHAFRSARGETTFINRQGALVIAGARGTAVATIPVSQRDERPDLPVLSPDGSKIAFHVEPVYYESRVLVVTRDGRKLAEFKDVTEPNWTPDGRLVVAKRMNTVESKPGIYISDTNLTRLTRVDPDLDNASWPAVSPDGKRIAFVHHGHIWLMNLDGTGLKQLTFTDNGEERLA